MDYANISSFFVNKFLFFQKKKNNNNNNYNFLVQKLLKIKIYQAFFDIKLCIKK